MNRDDAKLLCMLLNDKCFFCTDNTITVQDDFGSDGYVIMKKSYYDNLVEEQNSVKVFGSFVKGDRI